MTFSKILGSIWSDSLSTSATSLLPLSNLFLCFGLRIIFLCLSNGCPPSCLSIRQDVFACHGLAIDFSLITSSLPFKSVYGHLLWTLKPIFNFYIATGLISCLCIVFICCNINFMGRKFLLHYHILNASIYGGCSVSRIWLCDPMDNGLPGSSVHGILQARALHFLLEEIFLTQASNLCLLHWQADSLPVSHLRSLPVFIKHCKTLIGILELGLVT